jgi:hypothetical protein
MRPRIIVSIGQCHTIAVGTADQPARRSGSPRPTKINGRCGSTTGPVSPQTTSRPACTGRVSALQRCREETPRQSSRNGGRPAPAWRGIHELTRTCGCRRATTAWGSASASRPREAGVSPVRADARRHGRGRHHRDRSYFGSSARHRLGPVENMMPKAWSTAHFLVLVVPLARQFHGRRFRLIRT